jgi:hypothetical protein
MIKRLLLLFWLLFCFCVLFGLMLWVAFTGVGEKTQEEFIDSFIKHCLFKI